MNTSIKKTQAGVPTGGTTGQALVKSSNSDFDYEWGAAGGGGGVLNPFTYGQTISARDYVMLSDGTQVKSFNQQSVSTGVNAFLGQSNTSGTWRFSQIFTTPDLSSFPSPTLKKIQVYTAQTYTTNDVQLDIYAESGGIPTGSSLGTATATISIGGGSPGWRDIIFGTPVVLSPSTNYCFVIKFTTSNSAPFDFQGSYDTPVFQLSTDSGATYTAQTTKFAYTIFITDTTTAGKVYVVDSSLSNLKNYVGYAISSGVVDNIGLVQSSGNLTGFIGLTAGVTQVKESVNVGVAVSSTEVMIVQPSL